MIAWQIKSLEVKKPISFLDTDGKDGAIDCGEYFVTKRTLEDRGMKFIYYYLQKGGRLIERGLSADFLDELANKGYVQIVWDV